MVLCAWKPKNINASVVGIFRANKLNWCIIIRMEWINQDRHVEIIIGKAFGFYLDSSMNMDCMLNPHSIEQLEREEVQDSVIWIACHMRWLQKKRAKNIMQICGQFVTIWMLRRRIYLKLHKQIHCFYQFHRFFTHFQT